ncbi:MAG: ABC transporter ATP-binding protein [Deltaproteobacteria bacterium]|nr:ABC transporter ATP-binding protein [Deltaproteobacteria bacterium]
MIEVERLTRRYGDFVAINDVSFRVEKGEVLGFLGPNGAGKSTTMRILSGCIGATSGRALIGGKDVLDDPQGVKRRIGYLPEVPPVYGSMAVADYVAFAAQIKGVSDVAGAVDKALARVGLDGVRDRIIENLSKGYRQRVGLAQALVHDPEVLILDEPTSGLDPAQRREIRDLLRELAGGHRTVILSTHVLSEIEAVCERVVIINQGRVVASDSIAHLSAAAQQVRLHLARPDEALAAELRALSGVSAVEVGPEGRWRVAAGPEHREQIAAAAVRCGLLELTPEQGLEEAYLRLTHRGAA